jgi:cell division protein FtsN
MKFWSVYFVLFILLAISCRKKIAEDYQYYQPYKRNIVTVKDTISPSLALDSVINVVVNEEIRAIDLSRKYIIVLASFSVEEYALTMKTDLKNQGYNPEILMLNNDGWHKLAIGSYDNYEEATLAMKRIKQKGGIFSNARIVIK